MYTFRTRCMRDPELEFGDGITKYFCNTAYEGDDIPEELKILYNYIWTGRATDELIRKIESYKSH